MFSFTVQRIAGLKTQDALKVLAERLAKHDDRPAEGSGGGDLCHREIPTKLNFQAPRLPNPKGVLESG